MPRKRSYKLQPHKEEEKGEEGEGMNNNVVIIIMYKFDYSAETD